MVNRLLGILTGLLLTITPLKAEIPQWLKVTSVYTAQIALQATGDALNTHGNKTLGHTLNAASTGLILASPFIIHYDKQPAKYMSAYVCLRFGAFDPIYNVASGLPVGYIGNSSITDKFWQSVNPPTGAQMFGRAVVFSIGVGILINY